MLFAMRAMGLLSGVTTNLDPEFEPWSETAPFALRLIQEDVTKAVRGSFQDFVSGRLLSAFASSLLGLLSGSRPKSPAAPVPEVSASDEVRTLRKRVNRLTAIVVATGVLAVGAVLKTKGVRVHDAVVLLWPGNDLGKWIIEIVCVTLSVIVLQRAS